MTESKEKRIDRFLRGRPRVRGNPVRLRGDASTRSFYRVFIGNETAVMMVLETPQPQRELDYINVGNHLATCGVGVPKLYGYDAENGILLLEDFGDVLLEESAADADGETLTGFYRQAIDELLKIHVRGTVFPGDCVGFHRAFDEKKLAEELDFFLENTVEGFFAIRIGSRDRETIRNGFTLLSAEIASYPRVFSHRDYHSRNLMIADGAIRIVDFQDARMGPCQYDLASLLRDSYTVLEDSFRNEMIDYYLERSAEEGMEWYDRSEFLRRFDLVSLQRNLKACGTFGYMAAVRGDGRYCRYLEPTLAYVRENIPKFARMSDCMELLARSVPYLG